MNVCSWHVSAWKTEFLCLSIKRATFISKFLLINHFNQTYEGNALLGVINHSSLHYFWLHSDQGISQVRWTSKTSPFSSMQRSCENTVVKGRHRTTSFHPDVCEHKYFCYFLILTIIIKWLCFIKLFIF